MIEVDDEEKVINAVYLMTFLAVSASDGMHGWIAGRRSTVALHHYHDWPGNNGSIGLMIFLNRSLKV